MTDDELLEQPFQFFAAIVRAMNEIETDIASGEASMRRCRQRMAELDKLFPGTSEQPSSSAWPLWMFSKHLLNEAESLLARKKGIGARQ